jgi:large subunit ribosomal protein L9
MDTVVTFNPQGFAHLATSSAKKVLAENLKQRAHKEAKVVADAKSLAEALKLSKLKSCKSRW